jgi:hypothetical protein
MKRTSLLIFCVFISFLGQSQTAYTFSGNGNWTVSSNWNNNIIPPATLPAGDTIYIAPSSGDSCVLNFLQTISRGAVLNVTAGANFIITGNLNVVTDSVLQQLKLGLLAYYPFNGSAADESGNTYDLSVHGAVMMNDRFGQSQKAYNFNGSSDYMVIPKILKADSLREFTISVWVNPEIIAHNSIMSFLSKEPHICRNYLGFDYNGVEYNTWHQIIAGFSPGNCTTMIIRDTINDPVNKWCHIILTQRYHTETPGFIYYEYSQFFNGKKLKQAGSINSPIAACFSQGGVIGASNQSGNYSFNFDYFKGGIDDIRIYDRVLSDDEILKLYNLNE